MPFENKNTYMRSSVLKRLEEVFEPRQASVLAEVIEEAYGQLVKVGDFNELKEIVRDLGVKIGELAEAQKKTEQRVDRLEKVVGELAEAQKRTEQRVEELAEAQKKTEQRVEELAQAQKKTEQRVEELAQAQKKTETELQNFIKEHRETRKQLGGLTITVGYTLENAAYKALPALLRKDHGLLLKGRLRRQFIKDKDGKDMEVNLIGEASKRGRKVMVIGECKSQLSKNGVDEFLRRLKRLEGVYSDVFPVLVTHMVSGPEVEGYVKEKGVALYYSYDF